MVAGIYPWYKVSWSGAFIGIILGFIDGFIGGYLVAWLYNKLGD
jgi:fructose-specific phosphotransferase system IIC component